MKENKIYYANHKEKKTRDYVFYANQFIRDRDKERHESHEVETQYDFKRDNLICTCRKGKISKKRPDIRQFRYPKEIYAYHERSRSFTDIRIGSVKALLKKKVKRVYGPDTDHKGCGSTDVSSFIMQKAKQDKPRYYYECKNTSSKCVGGILEYNTVCTMNERLSPINQTVSACTSSWKGIYTNAEVGSNIVTRILINNTTQVENNEKEIGIDVEIERTKDQRKSVEKVVIETIKPIVNINTDGKKSRKSKILDKYSSNSLVQHVYDLENSSYGPDKPSLSPPGLEKEYTKLFKEKDSNSKKPNITDNKSASFKRKFEALRKGLIKKDDSKKNSLQLTSLASISVTSHRDVSINSDPPSLEAHSFSQTKIYSPDAFPSFVEHDRVNIYKSEPPYKASITERHAKNRLHKTNEEDYENQGVKGMFKIWGEKFNLEDGNVNISSTIPSSVSVKKFEKPDNPIKSQTKTITEDKNKRMFSFFMRKAKEKEKVKEDKSKSKKNVTTGRCEVKERLQTNKAENKHKPTEKVKVKKREKIPDVFDETTKALWPQKFLSHDSRNSVKVRWRNNKAYTTSSSTVFELMDTVYKDTGIVFRSKSDINIQSPHITHTRRKNVNFAQQDIQAWMMQRSVPDKILNLPFLKRELMKSKNKSIEITIFDQKWFIDKSRAFSHKIEVVLHSKNIVARDRENSSDYLSIDIPKGYFVESNEESVDSSNKQNQSSDEQVYIVEYETESKIKNEINNREFDTGNYKDNIINTTSTVIIDNTIETPKVRDIAVKSSICLPKRCDVIEVGVITQTDKKLKTGGHKPILKLRREDAISDSESEVKVRQGRRKCDLVENYLQEYYRHWTTLGLDMPSWCSDSHFQCCSETSTNVEEESQSCPNMFRHFQTLMSSVEATKTVCPKKCYEKPTSEDKTWYSGLKTKLGCKTASKKPFFDPFAIKRVHPKDSIAVAKKRKLYASSLKSQWGTDSSEIPPKVLSTGDSCGPFKEEIKCTKPVDTEIQPCTPGSCPSLQNVKTSKDMLDTPCTLTTCGSFRNEMITSTDKLQLSRKSKDANELKRNKNKGEREKRVSIEDIVDVRANDEPGPGILTFKTGPIKEPLSLKMSNNKKISGVENKDSQISKKTTSPKQSKSRECSPKQSVHRLQSLECSPLQPPLRTLSPREEAALQLKISTFQPDLGQMQGFKIENRPSSENVPTKEPGCKASPCTTPPKAENCDTNKTSDQTPVVTQHCECKTSDQSSLSQATKCCCGAPSNESSHQSKLAKEKHQTKKCPHTPQICKHPFPPCPGIPEPPQSCACAAPTEVSEYNCRSCPTCAKADSPSGSYPSSKSFPNSSPAKSSPKPADLNEQCCVRHPCQDSSMSCKSQHKSGLEKLLSMIPPSLSRLCKHKPKSLSKKRSIGSAESNSDDNNSCLNTLVSASKTKPCAACHSPPQPSPPPKLSQGPSSESICSNQCPITSKKSKTKNCSPCCPASPKSSTSSTKFKLPSILKRLSPILKCSSSKMSLSPDPIPSPVAKPKQTGLHLKMAPMPISKPLAPKRSCPGCFTALNSEDQITIRLKKQTPSTEEIRESMNIKVQDEDGITLYERKDYTSPLVLNNDRVKSCVVGDIYQQSQVHRVQKCTTPLIEQMDANKDCQKDISEIKSATSIANTIEIEFKLKVTPGDKTAEINIGDDEINSKNSKKPSQKDILSQEVFVLKKDEVDDESGGKNDVNIRIVIKNFKSKSDRNQNLKHKDYSDEFANQITDKFRSVSTGYNDIEQDHVFSRHRATVDLTSSVEKRRIQRNKIKASESNIKAGIGNTFATEYICSHSSEKIANDSRNIEKHSTYSVINKTESYSNMAQKEIDYEKTNTVKTIITEDVKAPDINIEKPDTNVMTQIIDVIRQGIAITGKKMKKRSNTNVILQRTEIENQEKDVEGLEIQETVFKQQNNDIEQLNTDKKNESYLEKQCIEVEKHNSGDETLNIDKETPDADGIQEIDSGRNKTCVQRLNIFFKRPDADVQIPKTDFEKQGDDIKRLNCDIHKEVTDVLDTNIADYEIQKADSKGQINNIKVVEDTDIKDIEKRESDTEKKEMKNSDNDFGTQDIEISDTVIQRPNSDIEIPETDVKINYTDIENLDTDMNRSNTDIEIHETDTEKLETDTKYDTAATTDTDDMELKKPHTKQEKKEMLKKVLKKAQNKSKSQVRKLRDMLKVILTSDSEPEDPVPSKNIARNLTYASLKPNYFREQDSINAMNNYFRVESSLLLSDKERNKEMMYPGNNSISSKCSDSDFSDSDIPLAPRPGNGCLCGTIAGKLKMASRMDNEGGCCCAKRKPACCSYAKSKEICCDLTQSSDFFQPKPTECVHVETQNSRNSVSRNTSTYDTNNYVRSSIALPIEINQEIKMDSEGNKYVKSNSSNKPEIKRPKNSILNVSDESKIVRTESKNTYSESKTTNEDTLEHILQSYEAKKAVLEIYAEKTVSNEGEKLVARLPKFLSGTENEIQSNYDAITSNTYKTCKRNIFMLTIDR